MVIVKNHQIEPGLNRLMIIEIMDLPNELWIDIILQLDLADLNGWRCATRQFHAIYTDDYHWHCRLKRRFGSDPTILQPPGVSMKRLYRYWIRYRSAPCHQFVFSSGERPGLNRMNTKIKRSLLANGLKAGDLVKYTTDKTEGYIYDGTQFHFLSIWRSDGIPGLYPIEDFPIMHWSSYFDSIVINLVPYREELIKNFEFVQLQNQFHGQCLHRTHFTHWTGLIYVILILVKGSYDITKEDFTKYVTSSETATCHLTTSKYAKFFKNIKHLPDDPNQILYLVYPYVFGCLLC